jgi:hypothetical protein
LLTNIIDGVHIVKLYGWDEGFLKIMLDIRKRESKMQAMKYLPRTISLSLLISGLGILIMLITLAHIETDNEMTLSLSVYLVMNISIMLFVNFGYFALSFDFILQMLVNTKRIG